MIHLKLYYYLEINNFEILFLVILIKKELY